MLNKWNVSEVEKAEWFIKFSVGDYLTIAHIAQFADRLLEIGEREQVYYLHNTWAGYKADQHQSFGTFLQDMALKITDERLPFFEYWMSLLNPANDMIIATSRIAYYDASGNVIENEVSNLGHLLFTLRPEEINNHPSYAEDRMPLSLASEEILIRDQKIVEDVELGIALYSDIWFPWILGLPIDRKWDNDASRHVLCDNRELANRHTPRLNRFLAEARELTLSMGGKWDVETFYPDMVTENGINLDYDYEQEKNKKLDM